MEWVLLRESDREKTGASARQDHGHVGGKGNVHKSEPSCPAVIPTLLTLRPTSDRN
jgi:hypothetical protein